MSTLFAGATVTVTPRSAVVTAPATMQAQVNAPAGTLPYQVITSSRTASTSVPATGTKQVSLAASGIMTIYNTSNALKCTNRLDRKLLERIRMGVVREEFRSAWHNTNALFKNHKCVESVLGSVYSVSRNTWTGGFVHPADYTLTCVSEETHKAGVKLYELCISETIKLVLSLPLNVRI